MHLTVVPSRLSNFMQYVDSASVTVVGANVKSATGRETLKQLIVNLTVSQCLMRTKRLTFVSECSVQTGFKQSNVPGGDYSLITQIQFMDFLEPRKQHLEWIGFDTGCINVDPMRAALNSVYEEEKIRPDMPMDNDGFVYQ